MCIRDRGERYFSSPARTRLAFGPGRAVLILGPARVLVVIGSSGKQSSIVVHQSSAGRSRRKRRIQPLSHIIWEDGRTSRYRTDWDAPARATLPDTGAGTLRSAASIRADANWASDGASVNIPASL